MSRSGKAWDPAADDAFRRACVFPVRGIGGALFGRLRQHAAERGEAEAMDAVQVMTLHRAKGLEFDHVLLAGLEEGVWPNWQAEQQGAIAEERRLFYVGVTRARHSLQLSWVRRRRDWAGKPSRFLAEIPKALIEGAAAAQRSADRGTSGRAPARLDRSVKPPTQAETDRLVAEFIARKAAKAAR